MRTFAVPAHDVAGAHRVATDLLMDAMVVRRAEDGGEVLGYRAAWLGSRAVHGALGVDRDSELAPWDLACALRGRSTRDGVQIRQPGLIERVVLDEQGRPDLDPSGEPRRERRAGLGSFAVSFVAPESLTREWNDSGPERRAEIERAMIAGADAALEHLRQTTRLAPRRPPDGRRIREFAHGVAALAIVRGPEHGSAGRAIQPLRAEILLVGVERSDGQVVTPKGRWVEDAEPEIAAVAGAAAADALAKARDSVRATRERARQPRLVGRDDAWVPDPWDMHRAVVGEDYARRVDDLATVYGEQFAERDDAWLQRRLAATRWRLGSLDAELAAATLGLDRQIEAADLRLWRAEEDLLVLQARADGSRASRAVPSLRGEQREGVKALRRAVDVQRDRVEALRDAAMKVADDAGKLPHQGRYLHKWMDTHAMKVAQSIAAARELAIRGRERTLHDRRSAEPAIDGATARDGNARKPPPNARRIGRGDVSASLDDLRADSDWQRTIRGEPRPALRVERRSVPAPKALDELTRVIGERRARELAERMKPVADRLGYLPSHWVEARHSELGDPRDLIDTHAALETLRVEAFQAQATTRLHYQERLIEEVLAELDAADADTDPHELRELREREQNARRWANEERAQLQRRREQEQALREDGRHLDDQLVRNGDLLLRALAYSDEHAIRREVKIGQQVERSVVEAPEHIVTLIGPPPDRSAPERAEWEAITRDIEHDRLQAQAGVDSVIRRDPRPRRDVDSRVDQLRAQRGMPPLAHELQTAVNVHDLGL